MMEMVRSNCGNKLTSNKEHWSSRTEAAMPNANPYPCWYQTIKFNYTTPPYHFLRENVPKRVIFTVRKHKFLDMKKKFNAKDVTYIVFDNEKTVNSAKPGIVNKPQLMETVSIRDPLNRFFTRQNDVLVAKQLQDGNAHVKALFIIQFGAINAWKMPVSLKLNDTNCYLTYQSGKLQLKDVTNIDYQNAEPKKHFFFMSSANNGAYTFEPVEEKDSLISTSTKETSPVTVKHKSSNVHYKEFDLEIKQPVTINEGDEMKFFKKQREETSDYEDNRFMNEFDLKSADWELNQCINNWRTVHVKELVCPLQLENASINHRGILLAKRW